jgi:WD40 repeat protein/predicted Ser/Thr protein kinase
MAVHTETDYDTEPMLLAPEAMPGERFGPYTTLRLLGQGGMGVVYLAEQRQPIQRLVALKIIKTGLMDTRDIVKRFESERVALALMDHPNIARVFDVGAGDDGRPWFAMEYVPGVPITAYSDQNRLNNRERLELFIPVCRAIQHAHQKGVIHRDIKPSNVLVSVQDHSAVAKVIDFGVAKATRQARSERAFFTEHGLLIGTLEYMSPEQVAGEEVDSSTDIYSLGILLYELLVGVLPFDPRALRAAGYDEIQRIIREEETPLPTAKFKSLGPKTAELATCRRTDSEALAKELRGDLDWITMKALDKERSRRYPSASELAADLERHLRDEPVLAIPPTALYRAGKFVRKYRTAVAGAAAALLCLMIGLGVSTALYFRARAAGSEADRQREIAQKQSYSANLNAAELLLRAGEATEARHRLLLSRTDLRGWEWKHLFLKTDSSIATLHPDPQPGNRSEFLSTFAFRRGRIFWSTGRSVQSWDGATYRPAERYGPFEDIIAISPDATRIISRVTAEALKGRVTLHVVDTASGKMTTSITYEGQLVLALFAPGGIQAVTANNDGRIMLWNTDSGQLLRTTAADPLYIQCAAISPDGLRIASAASGTAKVWDLSTGALVSTLSGHTSIVRSLQFPDGTQIATGSDDATIRIWETTTGRSLRTIGEPHGPVSSIAYSPDGSRIAVGTQDAIIRIWNTVSGSLLAALPGNEYRVESLAFTPDGTRLISAHRLGPTLRVWDAWGEPGTKTLIGHTRSIYSLCFSRDDKLLASGSFDGSVRLWDTQSGETTYVLSGHTDGARAIACSPNTPYLASGAVGTGIRIWDIKRGELVRTIGGRNATITALAFSRDGTRIASSAADNVIRVWDFETGNPTSSMQLADAVGSLDFSPDGRHLVSASGSGDPTIQVWDVVTGKPTVAMRVKYLGNTTFTSTGPSPAQAVYSPDGLLIAGGSIGPPINVWEAATGKAVTYLSGPVSPASFLGSLRWHPDGTRLAISWNNDIQIWDARSHELLTVLDARYKLNRIVLAFSRSGVLLASGSEDGTIQLRDSRSAYSYSANATNSPLRR